MKPFMHTEPSNETKEGIILRDGVELEKGVVLTEEYLSKNEELFRKYCQYFSAYPDMFLDLIKPSNSNFKLYFYQRIILRAIMRFRIVYVVACRAASKSFLTILALFLQCIFMPGTRRFICAPAKGQSAQIAKQKISEIFDKWPLLRKEIKGWELSDTPGNYGKDYVQLSYTNGSVFDVVGALDTQRGGRRNGGLIDEIRDHDEGPINEIVLPLMAVSRRLPNGEVNPKEPNQQQIYMTSAGVKSSFAYEKLIEVFENAIINPSTFFTMSLDYRIPVLHGLVERNFINELKMAPSFSEESFSREYLSSWTGGSEESWFNFDKMQKYRKIKNPELHEIKRSDSEQFYLISVDVGRIHDQTVVCIFRVNVIKDRYYCTLVNLVVLGRTSEQKTFVQQAIDIKKIIQAYNAKEVLIDTNGLGLGLADQMITTQFDEVGNVLPAYGFFNDDEYKKIQPKDAITILYSMKANGPLKSKIHGNCFSRINAGMVRFLIKETEAKSALMSTKIGQRMTIEQRVKRLMPHEMTTKLFEEMANLRLKRTGTGLDIVLEQINSRFPDDKYMAFAYGLWRVKELEDNSSKKKRRSYGGNARRLMFFTGGN